MIIAPCPFLWAVRPKGGDSDEKIRNYVHHPSKH